MKKLFIALALMTGLFIAGCSQSGNQGGTGTNAGTATGTNSGGGTTNVPPSPGTNK
jgi:hypothetical protein